MDKKAINRKMIIEANDFYVNKIKNRGHGGVLSYDLPHTQGKISSISNLKQLQTGTILTLRYKNSKSV
jgi:hypothetical protein